MMFQDENYLWSACIMKSIFQQVGCSPNFFVKSTFPTCTTMRELRDIQRILRKIKNLSSSQFARETGCLFQCSKIRYKVKELKEEDLTWKTDWISEVDKPIGVDKRKAHSFFTTPASIISNRTRPACPKLRNDSSYVYIGNRFEGFNDSDCLMNGNNC